MPKQDATATFEDDMQAFLAQVDVVRENWQHFVDAEGALKAATETWPAGLVSRSVQKMATAKGTIINIVANADFLPIDEALADANRTFEAFCSGVQVMQSVFGQVMKAAEAGEDLGPHSDALAAAIDGMPEIVAQSSAAQAAWAQGMAVFMPRYRKAKLAAIEYAAKIRQQR